MSPSPDDDAMLDEIEAWARGDRRRYRFVKELLEYFDVASIVLIVRAIGKAKLVARPKVKVSK